MSPASIAMQQHKMTRSVASLARPPSQVPCVPLKTLRPTQRMVSSRVASFQTLTSVEKSSSASAVAFNGNSAFQAVFAEVMDRNNREVLTSGDPMDDIKQSNLEVVLKATLDTCKLAHHKLASVKMELERSIERETKQHDRLQFTLQKCKTDQAYYTSLQAVLDKDINKPPGYEAPYVSASEELLVSSIQASSKNLASLNAMLVETSNALAREKQQVERLQFAVRKCTADDAYYRSLRMILEEDVE